MKLTEDDLNKIFSPNDNIDDLYDNHLYSKGETVKLKKSRIRSDELATKTIRKQINRIPEFKKKTETGQFVDNILKFTSVCGILGGIFFLAMNYQAYTKQISWTYYHDYLNQRPPELLTTNTPVSQATKTVQTPGPILEPLEAPGDLPAFATTNERNLIKINKIGVSAPIIWEVENDQILNNLTNGVVHYKSSSMPGERGNIFLIGHSSNYSWINSNYNTIFALLDKLINGDRIEIIANDGRVYTYEVMDKKVVKSNEVSVLDSTQEEVLSLMTCWPIGTSLNRLVIQAKLVSITLK